MEVVNNKTGEKPNTNRNQSEGTDSPNMGSSDFMNVMQEQLLKSSGRISSTASNIDSTIKDAINTVSSSRDATREATNLAFQRTAQDTRSAGNYAFTGAKEGRSGFATNVGVLKKINDDTQTQLKDLEQRKWETIQTGDAASAEKIADLQMKALEYRQNAEQKVFENLLSMTSLGSNLMENEREQERFNTTEGRLNRAQSFAEEQALNSVALEFGLEVAEGETLDSIVNKARPFVTERKQLELDQMRAELQRTKAETAKALQGEKTTDPSVLLALAKAAYNNPEMLSYLDGETALGIFPLFNELDEGVKSNLSDFTFDFVKSNPNASKTQIADAVTERAGLIGSPAHVLNKTLAELGTGEFNKSKKPTSKSSTSPSSNSGSKPTGASMFSGLGNGNSISYQKPDGANMFDSLFGDSLF